jgi:hypothetical protein
MIWAHGAINGRGKRQLAGAHAASGKNLLTSIRFTRCVH